MSQINLDPPLWRSFGQSEFYIDLYVHCQTSRSPNIPIGSRISRTIVFASGKDTMTVLSLEWVLWLHKCPKVHAIPSHSKPTLNTQASNRTNTIEAAQGAAIQIKIDRVTALTANSSTIKTYEITEKRRVKIPRAKLINPMRRQPINHHEKHK